MRYLITALKVLLSLGLLTYLVLQLQESDWESILASINWAIYTLLVVVYLLGQYLSTIRWRFMCEPLGLADNLHRMFKDYLAGIFYNLFLPTSVGGDIGRAYRLARRKGGHYLQAVLSTVAERLSGFTIIVFVGLIGLLIERSEHWEILALLSVGILGTALFVLYGFHLIETIPIIGPFMQRKILKIQSQSPSHIIEAEHITPKIWPNAQAINKGLICSAGIHAFNLSLQFGLLKMMGIQSVSILLLASIYSVGSVISMIPISLSGIGLREGTAVALLTLWAGTPETLATTFSLSWLGILLLGTIPGGIITLIESFSKRTGQTCNI